MMVERFVLVSLIILCALLVVRCEPNESDVQRTGDESVDDDEPSPDVPSAPRHLTATATGDSSIRIEWEDTSDNETGFVLARQVVGFSWKEIPILEENVENYTEEGLDCGTTYYYRVKAFNPFGSSDYSNTDGATTFPCLE